MKSSLLRITVCASLIIFAIGCGKDNKSSGGGGGGQPQNPNPVTQPTPNIGVVPADSQLAYNNLMAWYNSGTEGGLPNLNLNHYGEIRTIKTMSQECSTKDWDLKIVNPSLTYCKDNSTEQEQKRNVTIVAPGTSKTGNTKLSQAFNSNGLTLVKVSERALSSTGSEFIIEYVNQANGKQVIYVINTLYNSAFNPVEIINTEARTIEFIEDINYPF